jgi:hypothetical protein
MNPKFPSSTLPCCAFCQRLLANRAGTWCCRAFPKGIPAPLIEGRLDHRDSYPGDQGIRFEPDWGAPNVVLSEVRGMP